mmetsp:Transcript_7950/g.18418  ORF Transcript_7950/g.18418 Transcript_7950/m.18418 type:complete len:157 (-) Transcript_7950:398-868(-)
MNRRHRSAQLAGRASVQLHTLIFFSGDDAKEEDAYVLDVETAEASEPSFTAIVPRYGIEGKILLPEISPTDPALFRDPNHHRIVYNKGQTSEVTVQVFDKVRVKIWVRELEGHQRQLVLDLLSPDFAESVDKGRSKSKALVEPEDAKLSLKRQKIS